MTSAPARPNQVYSCELGSVLSSHDVPFPAPAVASAATSAPDGSVLLAISGGTIYRWHAPSWIAATTGVGVGEGGRRRPDFGGAVRAAAALPSADGRLVVLATERGLVAVDAKRGSLVSELTAHGGCGVSHLIVTPDGKTIVSVGKVCVGSCGAQCCLFLSPA